MKSRKRIKVREETILGMAYPFLREIHFSSRQSPQELLDTLIHEVIHICRPRMKETAVGDMANEISEVLWRLGYRLQKKAKR